MDNERIERVRHKLIELTNDASAEAMYQDALVEATEQHIRAIEEGRETEHEQLVLEILKRRIDALLQTHNAAQVVHDQEGVSEAPLV